MSQPPGTGPYIPPERKARTSPLEPELPPANRARIARATQALIVCGVCLVVEVWIAARFPGPTTLANAVVTAVEGGLAWLARVMYGWLTITPARLRAARVVRWVPILLFVVAGVAMLAVIQLNSSVPWAMGSFYVMAVAAAAAGAAGTAR